MMKPMGASVTLLLAVGVAGAQSLGEVARKERERREANAEAGRSAVVSVEVSGDTLVREAAEAPDAGAAAGGGELLERTAKESEDEAPEPRPPTARDRADAYARRMLDLQERYPEVLSRCLGGSWTNLYGETIGVYGDAVSCDEAEAMKTEYEALYRKVWAIEGASILKRRLPRRLDPDRA
jgi:hypothetical protein